MALILQVRSHVKPHAIELRWRVVPCLKADMAVLLPMWNVE